MNTESEKIDCKFGCGHLFRKNENEPNKNKHYTEIRKLYFKIDKFIYSYYYNKNSYSFHKFKKNLGTFFRWSYFDFDFIKILFGGHMSTFWDF